MEPLLSFFVFPLALSGLVVASHYFLQSTTRLGILFGLSPFVVGAFVVAAGTSLPELSTSLFSAYSGVLDVPVAQTIGSNIANILLVIGIAAVIARKMTITRNLIDVELPLIATVTAIFAFIIWDRSVTALEGLFLVGGFIVYLSYIFLSEDKREYALDADEKMREVYAVPKSIFLFLLASGAILLFSIYTVKALEGIALSLSVPEGVVAVTALALGTSLPEIAVSVRAVLSREIELVIGNIIGSNIFNILLVVGLPALVTQLSVDTQTLLVGLPVLIASTLLFVISGISSRLHHWEGMFFIILYILFLTKVVGIL